MRTRRDKPMVLPDSEPIDMGEAKCSRVRRKVAGIDRKTDRIDWPPVITLQADNGKYLSRVIRKLGTVFNRKTQQNCEASKSLADRHCEFQVEVLNDDDEHDGLVIALKGDNGKYLSRVRREKTDHAEFAKTKIDPYCRFRYYSLGDNKVALKGDNNRFLGRVKRKGPQDNAEVAKETMDVYAQFKVGENLIKKEFLDITYELDTATITEEQALVTISAVVPNPLDAPIIKTLTFRYTKSIAGTWNNEVGVTVGAETEFTAGIPFIGEGKVKVKLESSFKGSWGGSDGTTREVEDSTEVAVPAKTRLKVQVVVKRALIDLKFTYAIKRVLTNGEITVQEGRRGVYRNVDSYESAVAILHTAPYHGE